MGQFIQDGARIMFETVLEGQRLLHITLSRGAPDNVTAVLFQIV